MNLLNTKPDWIMASEKGSFAEFTIAKRKPEIIANVILRNSYSEEIIARLNRFSEEITKRNRVKALAEVCMDTKMWNDKLGELDDSSWFTLPWYFAESYFYRRLLECTGYFQTGHEGFLIDPFFSQKKEQMAKDIHGLLSAEWLYDDSDDKRDLRSLLLAALWGNRADLSNMKVDAGELHEEMGGADHLVLLIDNIDQVKSKLSQSSLNLAYVTDNVGRELYSDLALIEYLLNSGEVENITMFVKPAPLFVSDAMRKDVDLSIQLMANSESNILGKFSERITDLVSTKRLVVLEEPSLCTPFMFEEMPWDFLRNISSFHLTIVKGDANYRRVIGDRHWMLSQAISPLTAYFPSDLLLIRTLKSEIMVGLSQDQIDELNRKYENWLVDGFCGVVQLVEKRKNEEFQNERISK